MTGLPHGHPLPLGLLLVAAAWASPAQATQPSGKPTTITVTAVNSDDNGCGSHMGGFDAMYRGRRIAVWFFHEDLGRKTLDAACTVQGEPFPLAGRSATATGKWDNPHSFQALKLRVGSK